MRRESIARASANSEQNWRWGWAGWGGAGRGSRWLGDAVVKARGSPWGSAIPAQKRRNSICPASTHTESDTDAPYSASKSRGGGAHSQNERSNNTGSAGDDSICTVCVSVVKWNKFSTPQRYVKRKDRVGEVGERNVGITATCSTVTSYT